MGPEWRNKSFCRLVCHRLVLGQWLSELVAWHLHWGQSRRGLVMLSGSCSFALAFAVVPGAAGVPVVAVEVVVVEEEVAASEPVAALEPVVASEPVAVLEPVAVSEPVALVVEAVDAEAVVELAAELAAEMAAEVAAELVVEVVAEVVVVVVAGAAAGAAAAAVEEAAAEQVVASEAVVVEAAAVDDMSSAMKVEFATVPHGTMMWMVAVATSVCRAMVEDLQHEGAQGRLLEEVLVSLDCVRTIECLHRH
jgi:hypothetical protein